MKKTLPTEELNKGYKDYYILLESSLLGQKFDIIKCVSTREGWTEIIRADGGSHHFAASINYGLEQKWFVAFSHVEYAKLHAQAALKAADEVAKDNIINYSDWERKPNIILSAYPFTEAVIMGTEYPPSF